MSDPVSDLVSTPASDPSFRVTTETLVTACSGHETLLLRYDGQERGTIAIDENDNGVIPAVPCDKEAFAFLASALGKPLPPQGESRQSTIASAVRGRVTLITDATGFQIIVAALSERPYSIRFAQADARQLGTAIRGSFGFWG